MTRNAKIAQLGNTIDSRPLMQRRLVDGDPNFNTYTGELYPEPATRQPELPPACTCKLGVFFEVSSGRLKACVKCRHFATNGDARELVGRLLELLDGELRARGGTTEDALLRLEQSPELLAEKLNTCTTASRPEPVTQRTSDPHEGPFGCGNRACRICF